jgi:succinyl-CoA synthetase beta subunit
MPFVVRLTGTNQEEGNKLIEEFSEKHKEHIF